MIYAFDSFEFDTGKFELRKNGQRVAVQPQVFSLIQFLIENRERMISKSELLDVIWDGRIVSEAAVSSRIRSARKVLGDTGKTRHMIQTLHGRGLRFIADVSEMDSSMRQSVTAGARRHPCAAGRAEPREDPLALPELKGRPSIAVLPFENFSEGQDDVFFAAGLTEEVIANLSRFHDLFVFSRSTTSALADEKLTIGELRRRLGADFVIEGSIRKSVSRLRVTFQLIDTATDGHVLVEQFDRECTLGNTFEIQDKIALLTAARVANRRDLLDNPTQLSTHQGRPTKWETYQSIARYYEYTRVRDPGLHAVVRDQLRETVSKDPNSSDGFAALAVVLLDQYRFPVRASKGGSILKDANRYARRAVSLDADNAFAHQALAIVQFYRREFQNFLSSVEKCISLNPGKADALAEFGYCFYMAGHIERALACLERSSELNPLEDGVSGLFRAACYFMQDRFDEAMHEITRSPMPGAYWYHAYLIAICDAAGDPERAATEALKMKRLFPDFMTDRLAMNEILCVCEEVDEKFAKIWKRYL